MAVRRSSLFAVQSMAGASFLEESGWFVPAHFGLVEQETAAVRHRAGVFDLPWSSILSLSGPDTRRFCNGMFTQRVRDLAPGSARRTAMTDEKGKLLGLMDLWQVEDGLFWLVLDGITTEAFSERYEKFIILDDMELEDLSEAHSLLSVQGPKTAEVLTAAGLPVPEGEAIVVAGDLRLHARARTLAGGVDLIVPASRLVEVYEALRQAGATPIGFEAQEALRIEAGRARWPVDMGERALVHEMGLVAECCNFEKGCYVGQEVIHRIDVMGQVQKKLWGLKMHEDAIPPLEAVVELDGQAVGFARSGAREGGQARILALLRKPAWVPGAEVDVVAAGRRVRATVCELPFSR